MSEAKHTDTPWSVFKPKGKSARGIGPSADVIVARVNPLYHEGKHHAIPNAEFIVRACNAHADLLAALKLYISSREDGEITEGEYGAIEAAIAKAEGRSV